MSDEPEWWSDEWPEYEEWRNRVIELAEDVPEPGDFINRLAKRLLTEYAGAWDTELRVECTNEGKIVLRLVFGADEWENAIVGKAWSLERVISDFPRSLPYTPPERHPNVAKLVAGLRAIADRLEREGPD